MQYIGCYGIGDIKWPAGFDLYGFFIHVLHLVCVWYQRVAASGALNDVGFGMSIPGKSEGLATWAL